MSKRKDAEYKESLAYGGCVLNTRVAFAPALAIVGKRDGSSLIKFPKIRIKHRVFAEFVPPLSQLKPISRRIFDGPVRQSQTGMWLDSYFDLDSFQFYEQAKVVSTQAAAERRAFAMLFQSCKQVRAVSISRLETITEAQMFQSCEGLPEL